MDARFKKNGAYDILAEGAVINGPDMVNLNDK